MRKFSLVVLLLSLSVTAQKSNTTCELLSRITLFVNSAHYQPKPVDDSLSVYVFDAFINDLDQGRNIFTKAEYDKLSRHRLKLDDHISKGDCAFFDEFISTYTSALERKRNALSKLQTETFDYSGKDTIRFSRKDFPFEMTDKTIDRVLRKRMRIDILKEIADNSKNRDSIEQHFASIEKKAKAKVIESNICRINSILDNDLVKSMQSDFLNTYCNYFDPHSNYFNVDTKSSFLSHVSTNNLSFGLEMMVNDKEEIVVVDVVPGSPAAKSKNFEKDDVLIAVSNKKGPEIRISCTSLDAVSDMIYSDANKELELTTRKKNGTTKTTTLKKEVMKTTSNNVYSFIADNGKTRVGYIRIPSFYADFDGQSVLGCADDVAKEIAKLKEDNIKGIVIDVQDNGGGSMEEATKLTGMFIDYGPVAVLSDKGGKQTILKDMNRGSLYNGPMVLMINGQSASASEFFAAAMQDYKRAIVVGSTTLGKATMQQILPLEPAAQSNFVKLTLQKFYRITGGSNQMTGVVPDVAIPVLFDSIVKRENSFKTAIKHDVIVTKARFNVFPMSNYNEMISMSKQRVTRDPVFGEISAINSKINYNFGLMEKPSIPLTFRAVYADSDQEKDFWELVKTFVTKTNSCGFSNTTYEKEKLRFDPFLSEINDYRLKEVKSNFYIAEAINIITDWNNFKTN